MSTSRRPTRILAALLLICGVTTLWWGLVAAAQFHEARRLSAEISRLEGDKETGFERALAREIALDTRRALIGMTVAALLIPTVVLMGVLGWRDISRWQSFVLRGMESGLHGRQRAEESLDKLRRMEQYLTELSSRLTRDAALDPDREVQNALQESAGMTGADRIYLFQVSPNGATYTNTHESCREGVTSFKSDLQDIPWGTFPFFESVIKRSQDFVFDSLDHLPPEAASERAEYEKEGIRSIAIVPLVVKDELRGWLGFDVIRERRTWKQDEIALLKMLGGMLIDAMDRARYLAKIQEQSNWLDQATDAILFLDMEGSVLYGNKAAAALFHLGGKRRGDGFPAQERPFADALGRTRETGQWSVEWRRRDDAGAEMVFRSRWSLVRDASGRPRGILTFFTDVSETKKLEEQVLRTQRMEGIGTLAGGIAHDLNNVLSPLMMAVPLLKRALKDPALDGILDMLASNVKRGSDLVKQVLGFSRGHHGDRMPMELGPLVKEMEKVIRSTFPKGISVETSLKDTCNVTADPTQVHQVLLNLCVNARDAMPDGGRILIHVEDQTLGDADAPNVHAEAKPGRYVVLRVEDTGAGIVPQIMDKIFDPFFTTKPQGKGTGLGLTTVAGIMKNHGGFWTVYSEVGQGTRFSLFFPATEQAAKTAVEETPPPSGRGESILVVDDELSMREMNRAVLSACGYLVTTAADGAEATAVFAERQGAFDVVLVDLDMPVMDGVQTIQALRRVSPGVKVIASSGLAARENGGGVKDLEVVSFLPKPYGADKLLWALRDALQGAGFCRLPR